MSDHRLVFVCQHGAAKSVIAAAYARRVAGRLGLVVDAAAAGIEPDPEIAPAVVAGLAAEGIDVAGERPRPVTPELLARASRVVCLGCDIAGAGLSVERWDDVPPVSAGWEAAREVIAARVATLLAELSA